MSMHKGLLGQSEGGASVDMKTYNPTSAKDVTLGDYIARKTRNDAFTQVAAEKKECCGNPLRGCADCPPRKMSFEEWYIENEIKTYDKTEYDCMKMAWDASKEN